MSDLNSEITEWIAIAKGDKCPLCKGTGSIRGGHVTCPKCGGKKVAKDANESLATVMRHDQDHDNWHKMHGDAPCTSEADCAQKRAKYAEVQAEQVAKGDVDGHPFHGNQWSSGAGEINDKKDQIRRLISSGTRKSQIAQRTARRISNLHGDIAGKLADAGKLNEAQAHLKAADGWGKLARPPIEGEPNAWGEIGKPETNPVNMSDHALNDFEPWMNKSAEILKGDVVGHEFHGNQYTEARKLNDTLKIANNMHLQHSEGADPESVSAEHEIAAALHRGMSSDLRGLAQHALDTGHPITSSALRHAAEMHTTAAQAHEEAAKVTDEQGVGQRSVDAAFPAVRASREATEATDQALNMAQDTGAAPVPRLSF